MNCVEIRVSGSRFAVVEPGPHDVGYLMSWFDINDESVRGMVLRAERNDLVMQGVQGRGYQIAKQLREAGLLEEPPLPTSDYVEKLRRLSEEVGEYLPDYIQRVRAELAAIDRGLPGGDGE